MFSSFVHPVVRCVAGAGVVILGCGEPSSRIGSEAAGGAGFDEGAAGASVSSEGGAHAGGVRAGTTKRSGGSEAERIGGGSWVRTCSETDGGDTPTAFFSESYDVRGTAVGSNGTFTDECDGNGNLVEYSCGFVCRNGSCSPSGRVESERVDCAGECVGGACFQWCARPGDMFFVEGVTPEGYVSMRDEETGSSLLCPAVNGLKGVNCTSDLVGLTLEVLFVDRCADGVTTPAFDHPWLDGDEFCSYGCQLVRAAN